MGFAAIAEHTVKQRTLEDGTKVKSVQKTWYGNLVGWSVWVNGVKYFCNRLRRTDAEEWAINKAKGGK